MPYTLNARQLVSFEDLVNLYAPGPVQSDDTTGLVTDTQPSQTPTHTGVVCRIQTTPFATALKYGLVRANENSVLVLDILRVHSMQDVGDNWLVEYTKAGRSLLGTWWRVEGGKKIRESDRRPVQEAMVKMFVTNPPAWWLALQP